MTKNELESLTITELKELAKKKKVSLPSSARKADIVSALLSGTAKRGARTAAGGRPAAKEAVKTAKKRASSPRAKGPKTAGTGPAKKKIAAKRLKATGPGATVPASVARPAARKAPEPEWRMPAGRGEPFTAQERVTGAKFYTGTAETGPSAAYDALPHEYGRERIVLLPRDPHTVFAFWEVAERHLDAERKRAGGEARLCVRLYDVTGAPPFDGRNEVAYFDQEVYERVGSWYFNLNRPGRAFCADLGVRSPDGGFLTLLRSNTISVPRTGFSDVLDDAWEIPVDEFLRLYGVSGPGGTSSAQVQELMRKRRLLEISSPGQWGKAGAQTRRR